MKRRLKILGVLLLLGLVTTVAVAWLCAGGVDLSTATPVMTGGGGADWTVTTTQAPGALRIVSQRHLANWSPEQATGAPDTPTGGDYSTAWAPGTSGGQPEWIEAQFDQAVVPAAIEVYESYNPGSITRVTLTGEDGREVDVMPSGGRDPSYGKPPVAVSRFAVNVPGTYRRVTVYQGRPDVTGWNEVDAIALVDGAGNRQWASAVRASSYYGQPTAPGSVPAAPVVPGWTGLAKPGDAWRSRRVKDETRVVEARGWPLVALWGYGDPTKYNMGGATAMSIYASPSSSTGGVAVTSGTITLSGGSLVLSGVTPTGTPATTTGPRLATVPYRPVWSGLLADTLIFACVWGVVYVVAVLPRRFVREVSRVRRGCCIACGYDLGYDFVGGCPECGWRRGG